MGDFYAARSGPIPPLPWSNFPPPFPATVESVKAASEVYCPLDGEIVEVNPLITDNPSTVNADPQAAGWFFKLKLKRAADADALLDEAAYLKLVG